MAGAFGLSLACVNGGARSMPSCEVAAPMPLALDTGTAWRLWAAARGYSDDQIEVLISALPSLVASTGLIEVGRAGSRRWYADGNAVDEGA